MKPVVVAVSSAVLVLGMVLQSQPLMAGGRTRVIPGQSYCLGATPCVLSYHNDNNRDAVNPNESTFKASSFTGATGQFLVKTDGQIYGQPLYIHQLLVGTVPKNVVFVATENNSVYALDSDNKGATLAQVNLNSASDLGNGVTEIAVPYPDLPAGCSNIQPEVGITGTPAIDVSVTPPVLYLVSKHEDIDSNGGKTYRQKLHALYADTLQEIPGSPFLLDANFGATTAPGFDPRANNQRAGLLLTQAATQNTAAIWVSWGSHCDGAPYSGFGIEFEYNYTTGTGFTGAVFNTEKQCASQPCQAGIWMGGAAPAADASGNVFVATSNGRHTAEGNGQYTNTVVRLNQNGFQDFYTPPDYGALDAGLRTVACANPNSTVCPSPCQFDSTGNYCQIRLGANDWDLGAAGVVLLSPTFALTNPEIVATGKQGMIYVVYSNSMGKIDGNVANADKFACTTASAPAKGAIAQCFQGVLLQNPNRTDSGQRGGPAFLAGGSGSSAQNYFYVAGIGDTLKAFPLTNSGGVGLFGTTAATAVSPHKFSYPGAAPSVTWNNQGGSISDAMVWTLDTGGFGRTTRGAGPAILYVYRAIPASGGGSGALGAELWDSGTKYTAFNPGAVEFQTPTVVDGKIFIGGGAQRYQPGSSNCPVPTATVQPTACGAIAMYH